MIYFVIPARRDSKRLKYKNRLLLDKTLFSLPPEILSRTIVTTNDTEILDRCIGICQALQRSEDLSSDIQHTRGVMEDVAKRYSMNDDDTIVMLYLTYPQRTWYDIQNVILYFREHNATSLLCRKEIKTNPYLCVYESGKQVIKHDLYRYQDYPKTYEISHYIVIFKVSELKKLNKNLYNENTLYYDIGDVVDVDTHKDLLKVKSELDIEEF